MLDHDTHEGTSRGVARAVALSLTPPSENSDETPGPSREEKIESYVVSDPRPSATKYFDHAAAMQQRYINALSPLFG